MNVDAALDELAFLIGLRLMGPDERRRFRITLARHPDCGDRQGCNVERLERLDDLLEGRRQPETLQDRLDLAAGRRARAAAPFDSSFWEDRTARLVAAGFTAIEARKVIAEVQSRVDLAHVTQEEEEPCSG